MGGAAGSGSRAGQLHRAVAVGLQKGLGQEFGGLMTRTAAGGALGAVARDFLCKRRMQRLLMGSLQPSPRVAGCGTDLR